MSIGLVGTHPVTKEIKAVKRHDSTCRCDDCRLDAAVALIDRTVRKDAAKYPVKLEIELSQWESLRELVEFLKYVRNSANGGHGFEIAADTDEPGKMFGKQSCAVTCYIDGDGSDKIGRMWLNGEEIK
jgi:hypothetical protein